MRTQTLKFILLSLVSGVTFALAACSPSQKPGGKIPETSPVNGSGTGKKIASLTDANEKADALLDEGEALISPEDFAKSQDKFRQALSLAPENPRAKFWYAMNDFLLEAHGLIRRVHPFYKTVEGGEERYDKLLESYRSSMGTPLARFLFTGPEDIRSTAEYAEFFDRLRLKVSAVRVMLKDVRETEFTITLPDMISGSVSHDHACPGFNFGPVKFQPGEGICSTALIGQVGMNTSDFDQLGMTFAGLQLYLEFLTAYRFNQTAFFAQIGHPIQTKKAAKEFVTKLFSGPNSDGNLARPKPFINLQDMGSQLLLAMRYQQEHQATECPKGVPNPSNRKGYLFTNGNCIELSDSSDERERNFQALEALAGGRPVVAANGSSEIDYMELQTHPPENIKALLPMRFDSCAAVTDLQTQNFPKIFLSLDKARVFADPDCKEAKP